MQRKFTLGKKERLKSRKTIELLFSEGQRLVVAPYRVLYRFKNALPANPTGPFNIQVAVSVSSKNFKKAVDRNRIKRLMREAFRLQKNSLLQKLRENNRGLELFLIYTGKDLPSFVDVSGKVHVILNRLEKLINENPASHT